MLFIAVSFWSPKFILDDLPCTFNGYLSLVFMYTSSNRFQVDKLRDIIILYLNINKLYTSKLSVELYSSHRTPKKFKHNRLVLVNRHIVPLAYQAHKEIKNKDIYCHLYLNLVLF
ncbi:hypothetical protein BGP_3769 [Beggiatoa sp. PS]|nr:hypothetical protein BGP_3769 [Beggiatoa sp. PS]